MVITEAEQKALVGAGRIVAGKSDRLDDVCLVHVPKVFQGDEGRWEQPMDLS